MHDAVCDWRNVALSFMHIRAETRMNLHDLAYAHVAEAMWVICDQISTYSRSLVQNIGQLSETQSQRRRLTFVTPF
jgi:hypothetical protein